MNRGTPGGNSIQGQMRVVSGAAGVLLVLLGLFGLWSTSRLTSTIREELEAVRQQAALSARFGGAIALQFQAANRYLREPTPAAQAEFDRLGAEAHRLHSRMSRRVGQTAEELALIARIEQRLSLAETLYARGHRLADLGRVAAAEAERDRADPIVRATLADLAELGDLTSRKVALISARLQSATTRQGWQLMGLLVGAALFGAGVNRLVNRSVGQPLRNLVAHAERLSAGDLAARTPLHGLPSEFRVLAVAMNRASTSLGDLAHAEVALHQAEKFAALGQLVSGIAQELHTPLAGAVLETESLLDTAPPAERARLERVRTRLLHARRTVRDLLAFVKDRHAAPEPVPPAVLAREALRLAAPRLEQLCTHVQCAVADDLPLLMVDRVGVGQALANLVLYAARAAGPGGCVHLNANAADEGCEFVVGDNGPAVAPERLARMFEPFFTEDDAMRNNGLGLSAALGIVEQHRGRLVAEAGEHTGARFVMSLPAAWHAAPALGPAMDPRG